MIIIKSNLVFLLSTERTSKFLFNALNEFSTAFTKEYDEKIKSFLGNVSEFEEAGDLVKVSFGLPH